MTDDEMDALRQRIQRYEQALHAGHGDSDTYAAYSREVHALLAHLDWLRTRVDTLDQAQDELDAANELLRRLASLDAQVVTAPELLTLQQEARRLLATE